ncbi:ribonuclease H-like domain-containing protein [Tanacetum coccineum]
MQKCNPCQTLVNTDSKLGRDGDPVYDPTLYRSLAGAPQYLPFTRPDLSYVVQQVCLYMHDPQELHFSALKRIIWYVRGTNYCGLQLHVTRRSTYGYCVFLGDNFLSWYVKRQATISRSSVVAE